MTRTERKLITPHERFETIEEVFAYTDQAMKCFRDSGVVEQTPLEALIALFTLNEAFCQLANISAMHLKRAKLYIDAKNNGGAA